jgi:SPP1 family predicted phage head-tail adaptor
MPVLFLDAGQLTARLELEAPVAVSDGQGGAVLGYETRASLWARIEPVTQVLAEQAGAEMFSVTHRVWLRFRADLAAGMRLRKGARMFAIRAWSDPDETQRFLVCRCEEERG